MRRHRPPQVKLDRHTYHVTADLDRERRLSSAVRNKKAGTGKVPSLAFLAAMALPQDEAASIIEYVSVSGINMLSSKNLEHVELKRDDDARDYRYDQRDYMEFYSSTKKTFPHVCKQFLIDSLARRLSRQADLAAKLRILTTKSNEHKQLVDLISNGTCIVCPTTDEVLRVLLDAKTLIENKRQECRHRLTNISNTFKNLINKYHLRPYSVATILPEINTQSNRLNFLDEKASRYLEDLHSIVSTLHLHQTYGHLVSDTTKFPVLTVRAPERWGWSVQNLNVNMKFIKQNWNLRDNYQTRLLVKRYIAEARTFFKVLAQLQQK